MQIKHRNSCPFLNSSNGRLNGTLWILHLPKERQNYSYFKISASQFDFSAIQKDRSLYFSFTYQNLSLCKTLNETYIGDNVYPPHKSGTSNKGETYLIKTPNFSNFKKCDNILKKLKHLYGPKLETKNCLIYTIPIKEVAHILCTDGLSISTMLKKRVYPEIKTELWSKYKNDNTYSNSRVKFQIWI